MNEEQFVEFAKRVVKSEKHIKEIENTFGGMCFHGQKFTSLVNFSDRIAWWGLGFKDPFSEEEDSVWEIFITDFWEMVDKVNSLLKKLMTWEIIPLR
jgi:hypothetical protein